MRLTANLTDFLHRTMLQSRTFVLLVNACALGALFLLSGCKHSLKVKNLDSYRRPVVSAEQPVSIGLNVTAGDEASGRLGASIAEGLRNRAADVLFPYAEASRRPVDFKAQVSVQPTYKGSGANFFINFPGFLIFTPAWNGYVYKVNYDVDVQLMSGDAAHRSLDRFSLPIHLDIRHADMNRTWTEVSWLEVGVIALVGGIVFTDYDPQVSPLAADASKFTLGNYIAQEIVRRTNTLALPKAPAAASAPAPVVAATGSAAP